MNTAISSRDERTFSAPALLVAGAFFMEFLDGTVIATALPDMARDFGVTAVELNIGISAYLITLAVLIPASGWIADRFGARAIFTLALAIFTLASVFCGLSTEVHIFVAMRILQGVGGALMVPVGRLAVLRTTPKHQLIKAIAHYRPAFGRLYNPLRQLALDLLYQCPAGPCRHHPFAAHYP